ncbi:MAG: histidine phosphatase family protein [Oscillospiraceae bacterium]|nr:histidine phosphatase family protein [Oscillospiraceae bacterium]
MQIIFIRHADPDYANDSLTEKGKREAALLAKRVASWKDITQFYVSPLGRAQMTAAPSLQAAGREAICLHWLREVAAGVKMPDGRPHIGWDFMPASWTTWPEFYDRDKWVDAPIMRTGDMAHEWDYIHTSLDNLLRDYGYRREGGCYKVEKHSDARIVVFCHMGVTLFMLGHLLNISPMLMIHGFDIPPTGVTMLSSEEREEGTAYFRVHALGDCRHLYEGNEKLSQSGYFAPLFQEVAD